MKLFIKLFGIVCIFLIHAPKEVYLQFTTAPPPAQSSAQPPVGPSTVPSPSAQPPSAQPPIGPPTVPAPSAQPVIPPAVREYLNNRIQRVLQENPARDASNLKLARVYNDKRLRLKDAIIQEPSQLGDDVRAEEALQNFRRFTQKYDIITSRLEMAMNNLNAIQKNPNVPLEVRYEGLLLLLNLRDSGSIEEAENALNRYEDFYMRSGPNGTPSTPALDEEYRRYFEEILMILRENVTNINDPKVQNLLNELLNNPEQLKQLWTALNQLSEEDDDYEEDYFDFLFSLFG